MTDSAAPPTLGQHHVAQLRDKLLDLGNRNRLLNFKHSPRARTHIRIVDELPEFLLDALCDGKELAFQSLGAEPAAESEAPADETTRSTPEVVARALGLDPSYELPEVGDEDHARHADRFVQTVLFEKAMERKLSGIRQEWQTELSERGVHTLFAAFGFLEWYESDTSKKELHAPLLLHPIEMERALVAGRYEFRIRSTGEESQVNLTLASRLRRDFDLVLPELAEDMQLADYLAAVRKSISHFKRWRIRRYVTVGIFGFARLVMYRDLDEASWPAEMKPAQHPLVRQLLSERSHDELTTADDYPLDDAPHAEALPPLVSSADSSQTSAIVDVLKGKNLALKGPPGTGKSQTITNLIAAALHQGKSVLFVAEKMAALEVVQKRLADAGLAEFCLELHSTHAKKAWVLDRLRARMQLQHSVRTPSNLADHRRSLAELRARLNRYVRAWNAPAGQSGITVHDAVWREQACRRKTQAIAAAIGDLRIPRASAFSSDTLAELRAKAKRLADAADKYEALPASRPNWDFVDAASVTVIDIPMILQATEQAKGILSDSIRALAALDGHAARTYTVPDARTLCAAVASIPHTGFEQPLLHRLSVPGFRDVVRGLVDDIDRRARELAVLTGITSKPELLVERLAQLDAAARSIEGSLYEEETIGSLGRALEQQKQYILQLNTGRSSATRVFALLGVEPDLTPTALRMLTNARALLRDAPREILLARNSEVVEEQNGPRLLAARDAQRTLHEQEQALSVELNVRAVQDALMLRQYAVQLRAARWYSWLFKTFRLARSAYLLLARGHRAAWQVMADRLDAVADCTERRAALRDDARLQQIAGRHFAGADTDFPTLHATNVWATNVRRTLVGSSALTIRLRRAMLSDDIESLDELQACFAEPGWSAITSWLDRPTGSLRTLDEEISSANEAEAVGRVQKQVLDGMHLSAEVPLKTLGAIAASARVVAEGDAAIAKGESFAHLLGRVWSGANTDVGRVRAALALHEHIGRHVQSETVRSHLYEAHAEGTHVLRDQGANLAAHLRAFGEHALRCQSLGIDPGKLEARCTPTPSLLQLAAELDRCLEDPEALATRIAFLSAQRIVLDSPLRDMFERLQSAKVSLSRIADVFETSYHRTLIIEAFERESILGEYSGLEVDEARQRFRMLDEQLVALERQEVVAQLCAKQPPAGVGTGPRAQWTDRALIENELSKKIRHIPIRQLVARSGNAIRTLTPCFMMSPISVAQYLAPGQDKFDLLVIDEASQMRTEDALGALCRAKQVVVVGDPKQLPPSAFFQRVEVEDDAEDDVDEPPSAESVLDLALSAFQPARDLRWHYRSRHESLIAFSNQHFYDNRLQIFPSPEPHNNALGVELRMVKGTFQASINDAEARAIAEAAADFMEKHPERSLGVVVMNQKQSELISEYIDEIARSRPAIEHYRGQWAGGLEPFFVKNLENVQGDERDAIMIGMTYGPDPKTGRVFQRFGPINGPSGHRRLNVLFTRAKERVIVLSSMAANDILLAANGSSFGVRALKGYLQYAKDKLLEGGEGSARPPDSPFEVEVISALREAGYEAVPQIGVRGFFIDIGVKHAGYPHGYLCGIECDGASYHSSRTARDRDRLREDILTRLGWRLLRIWSTDWFSDPQGQRRHLIAALDSIRARASAGLRDAGE